MTTIATLEARYTANIQQFDAQLRRMQQLNAAAGRRIALQNQGTINTVQGQWRNANIGGAISNSFGQGLAGLRSQFLATVGSIAAGAGAAAAVGLADSFNRLQGSLKVAGLEGKNLANAQEQLFKAANENGVAVNSLGELYQRLSIAASQLGASQSEVISLVNSVTSAIRASGSSAQAAEGALTQFSQALINGKVQAEEWSSIRDAMPALVQAMANASDKYKGSIGALNTAIKDGKVASQELMTLTIAARMELEDKAARAPLTVAQSFEVLKNKMIEYMGATNETWGITDRLTMALTYLGENMDTVTQALAVLTGVLALSLAPAIGKAAIAVGTYAASTVGGVVGSIRLQTALGLMAGQSLATSGAVATLTVGMRALMSATGIGLAITAVTVALGYFAAESYKSSEATRQLRDRIKEKTAALDDAEKSAARARTMTGNLTAEEYAALEATAKLTGRVDLLTTAYGRMALAGWEAARAAAAASLEEAASDRRRATADVQRTQAATARRVRGPTASSDGRQPMPLGYENVVQNVARNDPKVKEAREVERNAIRVENAARDRVSAVVRDGINGKVEGYYTPPIRTGGSDGPKKGGGKGGGRDIDVAGNDADALAEAQRALADALRAQATTAEARHAASLAALADDTAEAKQKVDERVKEGELSAAMGEQLKGIQDDILQAKVSTEVARRAEELKQAEIELQQHLNDNAAEALRLEADDLTEMARNTKDMEARHAYEREALEKSQAADALMFKAEQDALAIQLKANEVAQAEIDRVLAEREANFNRQQAGAKGALGNSQKRERGPETIQEWMDSFSNAAAQGETFNQKLFSIAEGGISAITDGLTDAIMGAKSFGEAFRDMAKGMIAQLIQLGIQFVIFEMLGRAFGMPGLGRVAIGLQSSASGAGKGVKSNAMGTKFFEGGPTTINEKGEEIITLPSGSQVIPANLVQRALQPSRKSSSSQAITLNTTINAQNAVMREDIRNEMIQANIAVLSHVKKMNEGMAKSGRNRLG